MNKRKLRKNRTLKFVSNQESYLALDKVLNFDEAQIYNKNPKHFKFIKEEQIMDFSDILEKTVYENVLRTR